MKIAFDVTLMRPGCALLQAALGCGTSIANQFPVESWLITPTPNLGVYEITDDQLLKLIAMVEKHQQVRT